MTRRSGVTLVEVLVAIFVMAIGLIALLTLFPIGMLRMMQAIRDERASECAYNADKISIIYNLRNDIGVVTDAGSPDYFANPDPTTLPNADPYAESYPLLVDPIGVKATFGLAQTWVGGSPAGKLRRRPVSFATTPAYIHRAFTLWDDINFDATGVPGTPLKSGAAVLRDSHYSWAYLLRRPQTSNPAVVDCSIIIFDQRSMTLNSTLSLEEYVYPDTAYFNQTSNTIAIDYSAATAVPPPLRVGDWILDTTFVPDLKKRTGSAHAYFYRVVAADEFPGKLARYEVQNPIRGSFVNTPMRPDPTDKNQMAFQGTAIVIRGIAEVIEKGPVRLP
jgi:hypothetical protein